MPDRPILIAHRGASGYRPEHTLSAYRLAIEQGADFIEPDLVATADGALIARHENALAVLDASGRVDRRDTSTDVFRRPAFAGRLTTKTVDGRSVRGWFSEDFTLEEIRTLRAIERIPALRPANVSFEGLDQVPTLSEILALVRDTEARTGRRIGVYPETKHPSYFATEGKRLDDVRIGIDLGERLVATLVAEGFTAPDRVFIQSFEVGNLEALRASVMPAAGVDFPLIQLVDRRGAPHDWTLRGESRGYRDLLDGAGLAFVARYARGIGVHKDWVVRRDAAGALGPDTHLVRHAHAAGLLVHAWTFRAENAFLPRELQRGAEPATHGDLAGEIVRFLAAGLDGVFCDQPDLARAAIDCTRACGPAAHG